MKSSNPTNDPIPEGFITDIETLKAIPEVNLT